MTTRPAVCPKCAHQFHIVNQPDHKPPPPARHTPGIDTTRLLAEARNKLQGTTK